MAAAGSRSAQAMAGAPPDGRVWLVRAARPGSVRAAIAGRHLRRLLAHHALVATAKSSVPVAVAQAVYQRTGSSAWASAVVSVGLLPYLVLSGFAGVLADRIDRARLLRASATSQAVLAAALATCLAAGVAPALVMLVVACAAIAGTPGYPAVVALLPATVHRRDLAPANVVVNTVEAGAWAAGPACAGVALVVWSPPIALAGSAVAFAVGSLVALGLPRAAVRAAAGGASGRADAHDGAAETVLQAFRAGVRTVTGSIGVAVPLVLVTVVNAIEGGATIGLLYVSDSFDSPGSTYGLLKVTLGVGGLLGLVFANRLTTMRRPVVGLTVTTLVGGVPFALLAIVGDQVIVMVLVGLGGLGCMVTEVVALTVMLRRLPDDLVARAFGLTESLLVGSHLAGTMLVPVLVGTLGLRGSLTVVGAAFPLLAVLAVLTCARWSAGGDKLGGWHPIPSPGSTSPRRTVS